jgi:hypothetical protein
VKTLAEKVYDSTGNDGGPLTEVVFDLEWTPIEAFGGRQIEEHDREVLMFYFGCAYAIARLEDPLAAEEELISAAKAAAIEANRWVTTAGGREAARKHSAAVRDLSEKIGVDLDDRPKRGEES